MQEFIETVFQCDANDDLVGLHNFIVSGRYSKDHALFALKELLTDWHRQPATLANRRLRSTYMLAQLLDKAGQKDILISFLLSAGGLAYGQPTNELRGLEMLQIQADAQSVEQQEITQLTIFPVIVGLANLAISKSDHRMLMRTIEILKAADLQYRTIFDWNAPVPDLSLGGMRQRGRERARLVKNSLPPSTMPRRQRRVLLAMGVQQHRGFGLRMMNSMNSYGWLAEMLPSVIRNDTIAEHCLTIAEICRQKKMEILVFDGRQASGFGNIFWDMLAQLRRENPSMKMLGIMVDGIKHLEWEVMQKKDLFDGLVSFCAPGSSALESPDYVRKILRTFPPNFGDYVGIPDRPLIPKLLFNAGIHSTNWMRLAWATVITHTGLPCEQILGAFSYDLPLFKSSPLEYYSSYRKRMEEATCCLSTSRTGMFSVNEDGIVNSRCFEVLLSGALLVQEICPDLDQYFIAGEHYLEFSTLAELSSVVRFITEHREEAEEVRRCGHAFAYEHYRDEKLIGYMDRFLYFPERGSRLAPTVFSGFP